MSEPIFAYTFGVFTKGSKRLLILDDKAEEAEEAEEADEADETEEADEADETDEADEADETDEAEEAEKPDEVEEANGKAALSAAKLLAFSGPKITNYEL